MFSLINSITHCVQPYFPPQITFYTSNDEVLYAIDEINQQAYQRYTISQSLYLQAFAMKHFPYAIPDSPQSKNYVQLSLFSPSNDCIYGTYWQYGGFYTTTSSFPVHWNYNWTSFHIGNYINFNYKMIHSESISLTEDYWYADELCEVYTGEKFPCEEIYFVKNTEIPLRTTEVVRQGWDMMRQTTTYRVVSIGEPDQRLFDNIPKNWAYDCNDTMLGIRYDPQMPTLKLNENVTIQVWLPTPPHRINHNDTVSIEWQPASFSECKDCVTWTPNRLSFNIGNFNQKQILSVTRIKEGSVTLLPIFNGGGYDRATVGAYQIYIS
ncbi:unnamed protein product [Rotaria sp. Silwood1]|nr:unnamed protein product [Rotaria sp. Silwood1]